jgi:hypothetical protein
MNLALLVSHLGSLFLGVTLAFVILFCAACRHRRPSNLDSLLMRFFCVSGLCVAMFCYLSALTLVH